MALARDTNVRVNAIAWIRSLPDQELGPSRRMAEDVEDHASREEMLFLERSVGNAEEMDGALRSLTAEATRGLRPILQFDMHGHADKGLLLSPSGEYYPWDRLADRLRVLNLATDNHLCLVSALCYGLHVGKHIDVTLATPAYLIIAPENKVAIGFLEKEIPRFYQTLSKTGNISQAFEATLSQQMEFFHAEKLLALGLAYYVERYCSAATIRERAKTLASQRLASQGITPNRARRRREEKLLARELQPSQQTVDHFSAKFLPGRKCSFNFKQLMRIAKMSAG